MLVAELDDVALHYQDEGPRDAPAVILAHSLGTDLRLWDKIVPGLTDAYRVIRFDNRGHGLSSVPPAPYTLGRMTRDSEGLIEHLGLKTCVFGGLSIGGQMGQALASKRPELVRGLILANTSVKLGTPQMWQERVDTVRASGVESLADGAFSRWFGAAFLATPEAKAWRAMLGATPAQGYMGVAAALGGADLIATSSVLQVPTLVIAGSADQASPPDLVRETANLIPGAEFALIQGAGHLSCVDRPEEFLGVVRVFLDKIHMT